MRIGQFTDSDIIPRIACALFEKEQFQNNIVLFQIMLMLGQQYPSLWLMALVVNCLSVTKGDVIESNEEGKIKQKRNKIAFESPLT